jgi:hypothetical protein
MSTKPCPTGEALASALSLLWKRTRPALFLSANVMVHSDSRQTDKREYFTLQGGSTLVHWKRGLSANTRYNLCCACQLPFTSGSTTPTSTG